MIREVVRQKTKTLTVKQNGRSSDFVTPNFILSCNAGCSYCYTYRFQRKKVYVNTNADEILSRIRTHYNTLGPKTPNQTCDRFWTYDIGCDTDICYHWKDYNWKKVFDFFKGLPNGKAVFATKFVNNKLLEHGNEHLRIRFSLMPQNISDILEKNTSKMHTRIAAIDRFVEAGWEVHINMSPIVFYEGWKEDYKKLLEMIDSGVKYKDNVKAEVIFLTHNATLHESNLTCGMESAERLLWTPETQEVKTSQYGGENLRYKWELKNKLINEYKVLHNSIIPWCKIRYIF